MGGEEEEVAEGMLGAPSAEGLVSPFAPGTLLLRVKMGLLTPVPLREAGGLGVVERGSATVKELRASVRSSPLRGSSWSSWPWST